MKCWAHHFITETASRHKQPAAHTSTQSPIKTRIFHTWTSLPAASFTSIHRDCWQETENSTHPNSSIVRENTLGQNSPAAGGTRFNKTHELACRMWIFVAVPGIGFFMILVTSCSGQPYVKVGLGWVPLKLTHNNCSFKCHFRKTEWRAKHSTGRTLADHKGQPHLWQPKINKDACRMENGALSLRF